MALDAPHEASVIDFPYVDPFVNDALPRIDGLVEHYASMGFYGDPGIDLKRVRRGQIDYNNPATKRLCRDFPAARDWLDMVPTAAALDALYNPRIEAFPNGTRIDESIRDFFCNLADARGIRSRAAVFQQLAVDDALSRKGKAARWLSLACGAAHPALQAATEVRERGGLEPRMTLVDVDPNALALAKRYADLHGVGGPVQFHRMNVLDLRGFRSVGWLNRSKLLPPASYDLVEAIGMLEYLRADDWVYRYNRVIEQRQVMAGARTFLRNAWRMVSPGGHLLIGNMLPSHPQLAFTLNVIQWPHIQPRDVPTMIDLLDDAGVVGERRIYLPDDGVYALYVIAKPG